MLYFKNVRQRSTREKSWPVMLILTCCQCRNSLPANSGQGKTRPTKNQKWFLCFLRFTIPQWLIPGKTDKDGNPIIKPALIKAYNHHMGGVDRVDQQLHSMQA